MKAVLDDAVRCVEKYRFHTDARGRRLFHEAKQWLLAAEPHWPYSFEHICAVLDLDANAVRHRLRLAPGRPPVSVSREMQTAKRRTAVNWDHTGSKWNDANGKFGKMGKDRRRMALSWERCQRW